MKFKRLITTLIASSSLFTAATVIPVKAGGCEKAPPAGDKIYPMGPGQYKIRTTVRRLLKSNNERKINFAFKRLELEAREKLAAFVETKVVGWDKLSDSEKEEAIVVGDGDTVEDYKAATEIVSGINVSTEQLLRGVVDIGRCHEPGVAVMLTVGINSETAELLSGSNSNTIQNSDSDSNSNTQIKTYRRDIDQGY